MAADDPENVEPANGSQRFSAGVIAMLILLCLVWVYGLNDAHQANHTEASPTESPSVDSISKGQATRRSDTIDVPPMSSPTHQDEKNPDESSIDAKADARAIGISHSAEGKSAAKHAFGSASSDINKQTSATNVSTANRTTKDSPVKQILQNGHILVLMGLAVVLVTSLVVRQRYPWLQRVVGKHFHRWSSPIVMVSGLLVLIFGSLGFAQKDGESIESFPAALYETFQIFAFNASHEHLDTGLLWFAMIFAMVLATTVAAKGISFLFYDSSVRLLLLDAQGHVIVCGLGRIGRQLIEDLLANEDRRRIVVLEPDEDNHNLKWARENGVITITGDATKRENLEDIGVARAGEVFLVTGSDECNIEAAVEIRKILNERGRKTVWKKQTLPPLKCFVHVLDRDLALILREHTDSLEQLSDRTGRVDNGTSVAFWDVEVFNALERTARRLLEDIGTSHFNDALMRPVSETEVAHVVMLGFGKFGQTLALQLAELAHFENCERLRLTICDRDIQQTAEAFTARYLRFGPALDAIPAWSFDKNADDWSSTTYRPLKAGQLAAKADGSQSDGIEYVCNAQYVDYKEATDDEFIEKLIDAFKKPGVKPAILVCFEDDRNNFALAERLRAKLETLSRAWPIFVWIPRQRELSQLLDEKRKHKETINGNATGTAHSMNKCDVIPFGQCYGSVSYNEVTNGWTDWLARHIELVWQPATISDCVRQLHDALADPDRSKQFPSLDWRSLDELSHKLWLKKEEWARASNRSAAIHAVLKAAALGRRIMGLATLGERAPVSVPVSPELDEKLRKMEHYRWVAERLITGWKYDHINDKPRKTRWQITPWDALDHPPASVNSTKGSEKAKDEKIVQFLLGLIESGILQTTAIETVPPSSNGLDRK